MSEEKPDFKPEGQPGPAGAPASARAAHSDRPERVERAGRFARSDRSDRPGRSDRSDRPGRPDRDRKPRQSLAEEISELDDEIIRLLAKRARLLGRLRGGKQHAGTPAAIKNEKKIRGNWEAKAGRISRDGNFVRQLYNLVQDLTVQNPGGLEPDSPALSLYNLAPLRLPVKLHLPGPALAPQVALWLALASDLGWGLRMDGVQRSKSLMDFYKAFVQAGAALSWAAPEAEGEEEAAQPDLWVDSLSAAQGLPLNPVNKTLFVGDDELAFYLLIFLGLDRPGKTRFTGNRALKNTDFTPLYQMLPDLGARLAFGMSGSRGLPATLESSGELPALYVIPENLPLPGVLALLLAGFTWKHSLVFSLDRLPYRVAQAALFMLEPFFTAFPKAAEVHGAEVHYEAWDKWNSGAGIFDPATSLLEVRPALDPLLSTYLLAMPFFNGGEVLLEGRWPELPGGSDCIALLRKVGLRVELGEDKISSGRGGKIALDGALVYQDLPAELHPLFWVFNAALAVQRPAGLPLAHAPEGADLELAADFLDQFGLQLEREAEGPGLRLIAQSPDDQRASAARSHGWNSPGAYWTLAFSLGAFFRANLKISNPDGAANLLPGYWGLYNALPDPLAKAAAKPQKAARRRIMTDAEIAPPPALDDEI